jgi:hypothetical protein
LGRVSSSCCTSGTRRVNLLNKPGDKSWIRKIYIYTLYIFAIFYVLMSLKTSNWLSELVVSSMQHVYLIDLIWFLVF